MTHEERAQEVLPGNQWNPRTAARIAQALRTVELEAYERAAKVAESMGGDFIECDQYGDGYREARSHVAQAIRSLSTVKD
jgi:hypothetical protein